MSHHNGPGLKILSQERWEGPGYCGICGDRSANLVPQAVRWWDPDDGWTMGVLCEGCGEEAARRGPQSDDYAVRTRTQDEQKMQSFKIDMLVEVGDLDSAYTSSQDE